MATGFVMGMRPDTSSLSFFPDKIVQARRLAAALEMAPASRLLFVDISSGTTENVHALASIADRVVSEVPDELAEAVGIELPEPQAFMSLLPYYMDKQTLQQLRQAMAPDQVEHAVQAISETLGNFLSIGPAREWLRADPLHLRGSIFSRLPSKHNILTSDPTTGYPVSPDGKHVLLTLRLRHSMHDVHAARQLMDALESSLQRHLGADMHALIVGGVRHSAANARVIQKDVASIAGISLLCFALVYAVLVRSWGAVWLLLVPCYAATLALGIMAALHPALSGLALGFGASVLGVAEDYAVHMHFALRSTTVPERILPVVETPLLQSFLVNASGFCVLLFSGIPAVRQLACFALLTLATGFVLAVTIVPVCPWIAQPPLQDTRKITQPGIPVVQRVAFAVGGLLVACGCLLHLIQVDVAPRTLGAHVERLHQDALQFQNIWGIRDSPLLVVEGATVSEVMERGRDIVTALQKTRPDMPVETLTSLWPTSVEIHENVARWRQVMSEHGEALEKVLLRAGKRHGFTHEAFAPFLHLLHSPVAPFSPDVLRAAGLGELIDTFLYIKSGGEETRLLLRMPYTADISSLPPSLTPYAVALVPGDLEATVLEQFAEEKHLVPAAWLVCVVLLFCCFRNIGQTLLASLPPLCSISCILAWMAASGHPLTLASLAALPLVLGLSADHGILVTHDLASGVKSGIERAVLVSSLTTLTGMGLLALAEHPALRSMGEVIFWGLVVEAPAALCLLPRFCVPVARRANA